MKILVIAATEAEIALSIKHIAGKWEHQQEFLFAHGEHSVQFAVTGIGMVATAYNLTKLLLSDTYNLVIQAGIAGSFDKDITLGEVLMVRTDTIADMGAEDGADFINIFDLGLLQPNENPFNEAVLTNSLNTNAYNIDIPEATAITVNTVTGNDTTAGILRQIHNASLESMEGAAFHYVCLSEKQDFVQIRAISNYVEKRDKSSWEIDTAVSNLNNFLIRLLETHI